MKKKIAALFLALALCAGALSGTALAKETPKIENPYVFVRIDTQEITTYADEIEIYIARNKNDGKLYMRRWNATRGYWVDPAWILIS